MNNLPSRLPVAVLVTIATSLYGCATGTYTPPTTAQLPDYERTVDKSFDETWASLIDYSSGTFFGIDRFEKASGLLTLTFGSGEPTRFIDCGHMKAQLPNGQVDMPYAAYLRKLCITRPPMGERLR
jgi:hypothetical protein